MLRPLIIVAFLSAFCGGLVLSSLEAQGQSGGASSALRREAKTYRHPIGFAFWHPSDWTIAAQEGILQLTPPSLGTGDQEPVELYFLAAESLAGQVIERPDDPMILDYLDQQVHGMSPALQRSGAPSSMPMRTGSGAAGDKAAVVDWQATGDTGLLVAARAWAVVTNGYGVMCLAVGLKERLQARDADLRQMIATVGFGDMGQPPAFAGMSSPAATGGDVSASAPDAPSVPAGGSAPPQETSGSPNATAPSTGTKIDDPSWGFTFVAPAGWKSRREANTVLLGSDTVPGLIAVIPHTEANLQAVRTQLQQGLQDEGVQLSPAGALSPLGDSALAGEFQGIFNGEQAKARGIGTSSPYGGGAYIVAVTTPEKYGAAIAGAADQIARSIQYRKIDVSDLMQHFAGTWINYTTNTETKMALAADGRFWSNYEASYGGQFNNELGDTTGAWGTANQDQGEGRWTVRGDRSQGAITLSYANGNQETVQYQVHVENGQTYWAEYYFNGKLYGKQ